MKTKTLLITIIISAAIQTTMAELPRRAFIGTQLLEVCDSIAEIYNVQAKAGIYVQRVVEGSTAEAIGVQAPLMQTDFDPKGIIVFGTVARPWFEYLIEQTRMQRLILGQDYLVNEANHEQSIHFYYRFLIQKETPEQLMQDPEMAEFLERYWRFEDGGYLNGRHYTFWQQLQDTEPFKAWSQTNAHVLSLHGEGEYIAFNPYEHELIADIVNHYNPGKARFVSVPNIDHAFIYVNDRLHSAAVRNDGAYWRHNFNHSLVNLIVNWMDEIMSIDNDQDS